MPPPEPRLTLALPAPTVARFDLFGAVSPLRKAAEVGYTPTRPLGGWLATFGKIAADGSVVPTKDREGHVFEAAQALGGIDFTDYLRKGRWNDTHTSIIVGVPTGLEFHDATTELAKAHRKVGFWTEGHLFDRRDPRSWSLFTSYEPTSQDLDRADHFWSLATLLKGVPRPLGFSAHGKMILSPCGRRIIWAQVNENAVCEMPQGPDAVAIPLRLAVPDGRVVTPDMVGRSPCADCRCPPGARCKTVPARKAVAVGGGITVGTFPAREDLEGATVATAPDDPETRFAYLLRKLCDEYGATEAQAKRWIATWAAQQQQPADKA